MSIGSRAKQHCTFQNNDTGDTHTVQFNPESMPYSRSVKFTDINSPCMAYPLTQFAGGEAREVSLKLFYYDTTGRKIKVARNFFEALMPPERNTSSFTKPPSFKFSYGYFVRTYVLKELEVSDEIMDSNGNPTMTNFTLTMRQI